MDPDKITIDFTRGDDLTSQLNALDNERLRALRQSVDELVTMRIDLGEMEA